MTIKEKITKNNELEKKYFNLLDNFKFKEAEKIHDEIALLRKWW